MHLQTHVRIAALVIVLTCAATAAHAQSGGQNTNGGSGATNSRASHPNAVPSAVAALKSGSIVVDGKLNEAAWQAAVPVTDFRQFEPEHDAPPSERMDVRFVYDDDGLYIGARLYDKLGAEGVTSTVVRRDAFFNSDYFQIVIDGFHDHLGRAFFEVNPSGSKSDYIGIGASCCDSGWDPVWDAETTIDAEGWIAEIRIPYSQLRFSRDSVQMWGLQIRRYIKRRSESIQWAMWARTESGGPNRFGHLEGVRINSSPRNLEILPYAMTKSEHLNKSPGDPFRSGSEQSIRAGLDLKYLLTSSLTLDATINPDFGQVEVDPAVVNLSAFETFFQEKRPFFVSNSGVFSYGGFNCYFCSNVSSLQAFYSRRVGRAPTGADLAFSRGKYADIPDASAILGAAKITGRTSSGYTIGVMNAVTGRAHAEVQLEDGSRVEQEVEPLSNYFVGRLKKDMMQGNLVLGLIGTSVVRDLGDDFDKRLAKHAELFGADWRYTWKDRSYSFQGNLAMSNVSGEPEVILARQRSSARFYQRPGRREGGVGFFASDLDSAATRMRGYGGYARLGKDAGDWLWETAVNFRNPGFETNDYSFLTTTDYIWNNANVFRNWTKPTSWYRFFNAIVGAQRQQNYDGDVTTNSQAHLFLGMGTPNFWNLSTFYIFRPRGLVDDRLLRGGPAIRSVGTGFYSLSVNTDSRKQWQINSSPSYSWNTAGGHGTNLNISTSFQPSSQVNISFGPSYSTSLGKLQFVTSADDPTAVDFGGRRYILSDIRQKQLGLDTRVNVTFSPTMTLEVYAQPFIASGHYSTFKEFDRPRREDFSIFGRDRGTVVPTANEDGRVTAYTIDPDGPAGPAAPITFDSPDFNFRSLRGSAVFRWEYRPGSTLYFVWTQQRADQANGVGNFDFGRDREALLDAHPENIFLVKASWWFAR